MCGFLVAEHGGQECGRHLIESGPSLDDENKELELRLPLE